MRGGCWNWDEGMEGEEIERDAGTGIRDEMRGGWDGDAGTGTEEWEDTRQKAMSK